MPGLTRRVCADGNHCGLWSEEISPAGEGLGNAVQGFTVGAICVKLHDRRELTDLVGVPIARHVDLCCKWFICVVDEPLFTSVWHFLGIQPLAYSWATSLITVNEIMYIINPKCEWTLVGTRQSYSYPRWQITELVVFNHFYVFK